MTDDPLSKKPWRCLHCGQAPADDVYPLFVLITVVGLPVAFIAGMLFAVYKIKGGP